MLQHIFSKQFFSLITPPNREYLLDALKTARINKEETAKIVWNKNCDVKVEAFYPNDLFEFMLPSVEMFVEDLKLKQASLNLTDIWRNTYSRGGHQEIHNHISPNGSSHISGCIFLNDFDPEGGKFYFYNRYDVDFTPVWRMIYDNIGNQYITYFPKYKKGDIMFFPSEMLHGVQVHKLNKKRQTVSFNISVEMPSVIYKNFNLH